MGLYSVYDLSETLLLLRIKREEVKKVLYAWGYTWEPNNTPKRRPYDRIKGDAAWEGGFILELNNNEVICISGYNDNTGWGCMDYVNLQKHSKTKIDASWEIYRKLFHIEWEQYKNANKGENKKVEADKYPIDLNRWINKEIEL